MIVPFVEILPFEAMEALPFPAEKLPETDRFVVDALANDDCPDTVSPESVPKDVSDDDVIPEPRVVAVSTSEPLIWYFVCVFTIPFVVVDIPPIYSAFDTERFVVDALANDD